MPKKGMEHVSEVTELQLSHFTNMFHALSE